MNRKHKNKNKEKKPSCSSFQSNSSENESKVEQNAAESVLETIGKDVVTDQEPNVNNESEIEIPKAPKRQRNNKKKGQTEKTETPILEKEIENEDLEIKTDGAEISFPDVNDKTQISFDIVNKDEIELEQNINQVLPIARKKRNKNKKNTQLSDSIEEFVSQSECLNEFDQNLINIGGKNDNLTSSQHQSYEPEHTNKKSKDKKCRKKNNVEQSENIAEKKSQSGFENEMKTKTSFLKDLMTLDVAQKANVEFDIKENKTNCTELLEKQNLQNICAENENIKNIEHSRNVPDDDKEWKTGKNKKKGKKNKKVHVDVKQMPPENELISVPISMSDSEKSFEKIDLQAETNEFSSISKIEQKSELTDAQILDSSGKNRDNKDRSTPTFKPFDTNNNTATQEATQCENTSVQKVELKVPFLVPDTPFVQSNDDILRTILPSVDSTTEKIGDKINNAGTKVIINDELEELKLSFEKSLAELTALEEEENATEPKVDSIKDTSISSKTINNEMKIDQENIEVLIRVNLPKNLEYSKLQVEEENPIHLTTDAANCMKEKKKTKELNNFQSEASKHNSSNLSENDIVFSITEGNITNFNRDDKTDEKLNQKTLNESSLNKKGKEKKENKKSPLLQSRNEELHQESKDKLKNNNKQSTLQNSQISKNKKTESKEVNLSCQKFGQSCDMDLQQNNRNSDSSKVEAEEKSPSCDNLIEKGFKDDVTKEDAVIMELKEKSLECSYENIEEFEDALPTNLDDVNKSFEIIAGEIIDEKQSKEKEATSNDSSVTNEKYSNESEQKKENSNTEKGDLKRYPLVSHPKNLLGPLDTPVSSNKTDYKKEKSKKSNEKPSKIKTKDSLNTDESLRQCTELQTVNKKESISNDRTGVEPFDVASVDEDYVYKYNFRKVFLPVNCHVCMEDLKESRVSCSFCNLTFYCSPKHKDDDRNNHQAFCFAVSSIAHTKGLKFIYSDAKDIEGQNYRLLRMQAIVSSEKILQRKLVPWEQEALLYPRMCARVACREWTQNNLKDCEGCGQIAYCKDKSEHLPKSHRRWCKSYHLYKKLVIHQQTIGKLEPKLPTRVIMNEDYRLPDKINELLATLYEEKLDIDDMNYAALTHVTTAPLTTAYCYQLYDNHMNSTMANGIHKKSTFVVHSIGTELQFEADALNKWEIFFLHLRPDIKELNVVLIGSNLNPSNLPLGVLAKIKLCKYCRDKKRRLSFSLHDKKHYYEFYDSDDYNIPDIVCAFNPNIHRAFACNQSESWTSTLRHIFKTRAPFCLTSYTPSELDRDLARIRQSLQSEFRVITGPSLNPYSSIRPDRNFISDDEMPLIFKNHYYVILFGIS